MLSVLSEAKVARCEWDWVVAAAVGDWFCHSGCTGDRCRFVGAQMVELLMDPEVCTAVLFSCLHGRLIIQSEQHPGVHFVLNSCTCSQHQLVDTA